MKIHWKFFWIILIFCLNKINATDSNSKNEGNYIFNYFFFNFNIKILESANVGQGKMALVSQEMVEFGGNERNEASSSKKREAGNKLRKSFNNFKFRYRNGITFGEKRSHQIFDEYVKTCFHYIY